MSMHKNKVTIITLVLVILVVSIAATFGASYFYAEPSHTPKQIDIDDVHEDLITKSKSDIENIPDVTRCSLELTNVDNIPDNWTAHILAKSCIGIAFPTTDLGNVKSYGASNDWDGELVILQDNITAMESDRQLEVLIITDTALYKRYPERCTAHAPLNIPLCHDDIMENWTREAHDDYDLYYPLGQNEPTYRLIPQAALKSNQGHYILFRYIDYIDSSNHEYLMQMINSITFGEFVQ